MGTVAIRQVSVWLDNLAPLTGTFAQALEWARQLGLPLAVSSPPVRKATSRASGWFSSAYSSSIEADDRQPLTEETIAACAAACRRRNVRWKSPSSGDRSVLRDKGNENGGQLWVFGSALSADTRDYLLRESLQSANTPALVCSSRCQPGFRVLVLLKDWDQGGFFLDSVIQVCRALQTMPVVLSIGRTETEAKLQQDHAEDIFARHKMAAFFDLIAGWNVRTAIGAVARWRRCNHVFVEQRHALCSWRWIRCSAKHNVFAGTDSLTVLSLPSARLLVSPSAKSKSDVEATALRL